MAGTKAAAALPAPKDSAKSTAITMVDQVGKELQEITSQNFYQMKNRDGTFRSEPDARALQHYANKVGFATKILESGMDEKKAWAKILMWPESRPGLVKEDSVTIVYAIEFQNLVWDRVDKGCERHNSGCPIVRENGQVVFQDGVPILVEGNCQLSLRRQLNRKMKFAERECITKAEARLHKKFLNFEWREEDEITNEAQEVAIVAQQQGSAKTAPTGAAAPSVKNAAAETAKVPEKKEVVKEEPFVVPKADIPTEEEMKKRAAMEDKAKGQPATAVAQPAEAPKAEALKANGDTKEATAVPLTKKRSERMSDICNSVGCSPTNVLVFIAKSLSIDNPNDIKAKGKPVEIDAVIVGLEKTVSEFGPKTSGQFIRQEMVEGPEHQKVAKFFLRVFAEQMQQSEGSK